MNSQQVSIDDLLKRCQPSDPQVIEAVVLAYQAQVYRLALSILNSPEEAEDAVQDALIQATAHLDRYQVGTSFRAWIYTIAVNISRGYLRKRAARHRLSRLVSAQTLHGGASSSGPEENLLRAETHTRLWDLVESLPEKQRLAVILHLAHDLSVAEIAQVLRTNPKTIYSRLYDAFRSLRRQLLRSGDFALLEEEGLL